MNLANQDGAAALSLVTGPSMTSTDDRLRPLETYANQAPTHETPIDLPLLA